MHLVLRKCDLLLRSLAASSYGENKRVAAVTCAQQRIFSAGATISVPLENPLHLEEI